MDNNFTGEKDGIFYKNGKPIRGFLRKVQMLKMHLIQKRL